MIFRHVSSCDRASGPRRSCVCAAKATRGAGFRSQRIESKDTPIYEGESPREKLSPTSPPGVRPTPEIHGLPPTAEPGEAGILSARGAQGPATRRDETSEDADGLRRSVRDSTHPIGVGCRLWCAVLSRATIAPGFVRPRRRLSRRGPTNVAEGSPLAPPSPRSCPPHRGLRPSSCPAANGYEITGKRGLRGYNSCRNRGSG